MVRKMGHMEELLFFVKAMFIFDVKVKADFACCVQVSLQHPLQILCCYNPPQGSPYQLL